MKSFKIFCAIFAVAFTISSCEREVIGEIFNSSDTNDSLVSFETSSADLAVVLGSGGGTVDVIVESATLSNVDRVFNVTVNTELTTSPSEFFTLPSTVTIPAQSYEGTLTISGIETSNFDMDTDVSLFIDLDSGSTPVNIGTVEVNIFLTCPIPEDYMMGSYTITDENAVFGGENFNTRDVMIVEGSTPTSRTFQASFFGNPQTVVLNLVCNELIFVSTFNTGFNSAGSAIIIRPATNNESTYNLSDDAAFSVEYDNEAGGNGTFEGSFFLIRN